MNSKNVHTHNGVEKVFRFFTPEKLVKTDSADSAVWPEIIEKLSNENYNYFFFRRTPFCVNGYKYEMDEILEKLGWNLGMGQLTYKENLTLEELLMAMSFKRAYEAAYIFLVPHPLSDVSFTLEEFISVINVKIKTEIEKLKEGVDSLSGIESFLVENLQSDPKYPIGS